MPPSVGASEEGRGQGAVGQMPGLGLGQEEESVKLQEYRVYHRYAPRPLTDCAQYVRAVKI